MEGDNRRTTDRVGVGAEVQLSDAISGGGEISTGEDGMGARLKLAYHEEDGDEYYLGYDLPLNSALAQSIGTLNVGTRQRYSDALSVYGEERVQFAERGVAGLTHAYGVDYTPGNWTFGLSGEWLLNRYAGIVGGLEQRELDSNGLAAQNDFDDTRVFIGLRLRR